MTEFPNRCHTLGRFYVTTCRQADDAPVIDVCNTRSVDGWSGGGFVIRFRRRGRAVVLGRIGWRAPVPSARLRMAPGVGALFRMRLTPPPHATGEDPGPGPTFCRGVRQP